MKKIIAATAVTLLFAATAQAELVTVEVTGNVVFNGIGDGPLGDVNAGETATMSFVVDSNNFEEGIPGDTRGYIIDEPSFKFAFSGGVSVGRWTPCGQIGRLVQKCASWTLPMIPALTTSTARRIGSPACA